MDRTGQTAWAWGTPWDQWLAQAPGCQGEECLQEGCPGEVDLEECLEECLEAWQQGWQEGEGLVLVRGCKGDPRGDRVLERRAVEWSKEWSEAGAGCSCPGVPVLGCSKGAAEAVLLRGALFELPPGLSAVFAFVNDIQESARVFEGEQIIPRASP